ncbi:hypothetical protein HK101_003951 [Irineochytrium annulatum]|nr:hypothetical protein HK101_003951 [Irineochytrium annulatum]
MQFLSGAAMEHAFAQLEGGDDDGDVVVWSDEDDFDPLAEAKKVKSRTAASASNRAPNQLPASLEPSMSAYEIERERRIRQNREQLMSLGMVTTVEPPQLEVVKKSNKKKIRAPDYVPPDPERLSRRLRGEKPEDIRYGKSKRNLLGNEEEPASEDDLDKARANEFVAELRRDPIVVGAPFTLGSSKVTIWELGKILEEPRRRELFWSQRGCRYRHQYPIGFKATKMHFGKEWTMTITDSSEGPIFTVQAEDGPMFVGASPTRPWTDVCIALFGKDSKTRVSGPYQFGFTDPFLQAVLISIDPLMDIPDPDNIGSSPAPSNPAEQVGMAARRGVKFGERKRGRPRKNVSKIRADWTERAVELGAVQVLTDEAIEKLAKRRRISSMKAEESLKDEMEDDGDQVRGVTGMETPQSIIAGDAEPELTASGRPRRKATVKLPLSASPPPVAPTPAPAKRGGSKSNMNTPASSIPTQGFNKVKLSVPPPETTDEIVDCVCDTPDLDDGSLMVSCDNCATWFHARCVDYEDPEITAAKWKAKKKR